MKISACGIPGFRQTLGFLLGIFASTTTLAQEAPATQEPPAPATQEAPAPTTQEPPAAQQAPPSATPEATKEATELEAVEVTGSRIKRVDAIAESPIYTVDRQALINSGFTTVDQYLNTLPQIVPNISSQSNNPSSNGRAFVDLRGLGPARNLVLIDGRRPMGQSSGGTVVDTNVIPAALVERIEVVSGGAAAAYGADAVSGVVNFILRKDFEGFALDSQFKETQERDGIESGYSMTIGSKFDGGKGRAQFNASYFRRDAIYKDARGFSAQATSGTGSFPNGAYNPGANTPTQTAVDNMFGAGLCPANGGDTGFGLNPDGSPFCTGVGNGNSLDVQGYAGPMADVATKFYPDTYSYNFEPDNILVLPLERYNLFGNFDFEMNEHVKPYVQIMFTNYNALQELAPTPASGSTGFSVPTTNPFIHPDLLTLLNSRVDNPATPANETTANFAFSKRFKTLGGRTGYNTHDVWQFTGGTRGYVAGTWNYDVYTSFGRSVLNERQGGNVRIDRVNQLLQAPGSGSQIPKPGPGQQPPACPGGLNLFGDTVINADCQAYIALEAKNVTVVEQGISEMSFTGNLFELPAGAMQAAVGASYRSVDFDFRPDSGLTPGLVAGFNEQLPVAGKIDYADSFAEVYVPLLSDLPAVQHLSASLGLRSTDASSTGNATTSYKMTLDWTINDVLRSRGGFQHAIRSPNVAELFAPQTNNFPTATGQDPCNTSGANSFNPEFGRNATHNGRDPAATTDPGIPLDGTGGTTDVRGMVRALCEAQDIAAGQPADLTTGTSSLTFNQPAGQFNAIVGGNPDLQEETADTWSIGLVVTPTEKLSFTVDYFSIEMEDVIAAVSAVTIVQRCFNRDGANPGYDINNNWCQLYQRNANTLGVEKILQLSRNQAVLAVEGIDMTANYGIGIGPGELNLALLATYLMSAELQNTSLDPRQDFAGTIGATTGSSAPEWKATFLTGYSWSRLSASVTNRYISAMDHSTSVTSPATASPGVDATWYTDVGAECRLPGGLKIHAGINNVSNQGPRIYNPNVQANTDPSLYDVLGRSFFLGLSWEM